MPDQSRNFAGLHVASFESRRADDMQRLIERAGGQAHVSPSMREVPNPDPRPAIEFANRLMTGQIDLFVLMTGVGTQHFVDQVERHVGKQRLLDAISDTTTLVRGPKPTAVLKQLGITPSLRVPEPNTWRELLNTLDASFPVANLTVGLQEYGVSNPSLIAGLEARGAKVDQLQVYTWDFPEDSAPLEANIRLLADGKLDIAMFTSANQVHNVLKMADDLGLADAVRQAARQTVFASIGPTCSDALRELELPVDFEASPPKMGILVNRLAEQSHELVARKQRVATLSTLTPPAEQADQPYQQSAFLKACRGEPTDYTPVWLMRQAGRYMPEYREVRAKVSFLELCRNPQLCSEVMCTAVEFLGVDAAIIFSDLLPILEPMGLDLEFAPGDGPVIHNPVREASDVDRVFDLESIDSLDYVMETVKQTRADLPADLPLIGFAGAPFTLASYAIEGGSSRNYLHTKTLMYRDRSAWDALLSRLARSVASYLNAQIAAGAQAVQLFDSWVGCLGPSDYNTYVAPHVKSLIASLTPGVPVIHFGTGNPELLKPMADAGGHVVGVDWRIDLDEAWQRVGHDRAVQGNLEPLVLLADRDTIRARTQQVLDQAAGRPGHIFNLGHGVLQQTPPDNARALVDMVHELSS
ncbi:uroporphyrinogen decarboxylase [Aeoliella mucimassa]|uniref:Uroporphyrinogen decarboxylase n=1 Tax=Aeoliella mucimassa TaxID=2527972 RepID=A0A518AHP7_9BACT|nr:uroporphyrinogen decarboxylase [Aeoliella mucimassa]QDU54259.1 Uroporphyrinogen decarboxylase [Aeoliella mucimassa]